MTFALQQVLCAADGNVYAAGQSGTLIQGRGADWRVIDLGSFRETIWDLCWFKGRLFMASARDLLVFDVSGVSSASVSLKSVCTFGRLATNGDVLWSIGQKTLAYSYDGVQWTEVVCMDGSY